MKVFFDRTQSFYLQRENSFYCNPVEVPAETMKAVENLRVLLADMDKLIASNGAAETCAQEEADYFVAEVSKLFKKRKA